LNGQGVSLHKYRNPLIGFEAQELGTDKEIVKDDPSIRLAGVATHDPSLVLHTCEPAQQTLINIYIYYYNQTEKVNILRIH